MVRTSTRSVPAHFAMALALVCGAEPGAVSKLGATYFTAFLGFGLETLSAASQTSVIGQFLTTCDGQVPPFTDDFERGRAARWSTVAHF